MMTSPHRDASTPRERARARLIVEIKQVARRLLGEHGATALTLRAVAAELGLKSASALYRYFDSRDALLTALIIDSYTALGAAAEQAESAVHTGTVLTRWLAIAHGIRDWALANTHEYALIFGAPVPGYTAPLTTTAPAARVPVLLAQLLLDLARTERAGPSPPLTTQIPAAIRQTIQPALAVMPPHVPVHLAIRGLMAWTYLFGAINIEVFGHRRDVIADPALFFDYEIRQIAIALHISGLPPAA